MPQDGSQSGLPNPRLMERLYEGGDLLGPGSAGTPPISDTQIYGDQENLQYYLWYVAMSFFTFKAVNYFSWLTVPNHMASSFHSQWRWANTLTSAAHSSISGGWALLVIMWTHPELRDDVITGYADSAHKLCCLSVGYFAYDFIDMALYTWHKKSTKEMLAHHLAVGIPFFIGASSGRYLGGIVCTLFTEINSVFLHWRSLLKMSNPENDSSSMDVRNTGSYRLVAVLNLLTYIVFRMFLFVWFGNKLWLTRDDMPAYVLAAFTIGFAFIVYISVLNFYRLILADFCTKPTDVFVDCKGAKAPDGVKKIVSSLLDDEEVDGDVTEAGHAKKTN